MLEFKKDVTSQNVTYEVADLIGRHGFFFGTLFLKLQILLKKRNKKRK